MSTIATYLNKMKNGKIPVKVFLVSGTMLKGLVKDHDEYFVVLDECLINLEHMISIAPDNQR